MLEFVAFAGVFLLGEVLRRVWIEDEFLSRKAPDLVAFVGYKRFQQSLDQYSATIWSVSSTAYSAALLVANRDLGAVTVIVVFVAAFIAIVGLSALGIRLSFKAFAEPSLFLSTSAARFRLLGLSPRILPLFTPRTLMIAVPISVTFVVAVVF